MASIHDSDRFFHITHIDNIASMLSKGILSHGLMNESKSDEELISIREAKKMDNGKSLWHFANLYFQPRNPILYKIKMEKSADVIAVIAVKKSIIEVFGVYISDGNVADDATKFYTGADCKIQEDQIRKETQLKWWSWHDSTKRKIMAECLVPGRIPPEYIEAVYVSSNDVAQNLKKLFPALTVPIIPKPSIFFEPAKKIDLTDNLSLVDGDLFFSFMQTLVISVNCVGIMGKGLALRAKHQFPDVYVHYQDKCKVKDLRMGQPVLYTRESPYHEEIADYSSKLSKKNVWFLLFATKQHWRDNSDISGIEQGLQWLVVHYEKLKIKSLAIPALGCGLGRLDWKDVGPILCKYLSKMDIPVWIYLPTEKYTPQEYLTCEFLLSS